MEKSEFNFSNLLESKASSFLGVSTIEELKEFIQRKFPDTYMRTTELVFSEDEAALVMVYFDPDVTSYKATDKDPLEAASKAVLLAIEEREKRVFA